MESLRITRERNALQTSLKDLKRTQVQELCRVGGQSRMAWQHICYQSECSKSDQYALTCSDT
jgi:hypothetical protein